MGDAGIDFNVLTFFASLRLCESELQFLVIPFARILSVAGNISPFTIQIQHNDQSTLYSLALLFWVALAPLLIVVSGASSREMLYNNRRQGEAA